MHVKITLTPHLEKFVQSKVKSGGYEDNSEVIREALRLLEKTEWRESGELEGLILEADHELSTRMTQEDWSKIRLKVFGKERKAAA